MRENLIKKYFYCILLLMAVTSCFFAKEVKANSSSVEWTPSLNVTLTGKTLEDNMFNYTISSKNEGPLPDTTTVANSGENIVFDAITFTEADVGKTYYYEISQTKKDYYEIKSPNQVISVKITKDSDDNIVATENILKNTDNPQSNQLGGITWDIGGWGVRSTGNGTGSIHTLDDTPTYETTVYRISNNTKVNRDWCQTRIPFVTGNEYTLSGYVRIPKDSTNDKVTALIRAWDSTQGKAVFQKKLSINKSDDWVYFSYNYIFNATEDNTAYHVGLTEAGDIEMNGLRVESAQAEITRTYENKYIGTQLTVTAQTKGDTPTDFTFKIRAWTGEDETIDYVDFTEQGLTSIGNNEFIFTTDQTNENQKTFDLPNGSHYEISLLDNDTWQVSTVDDKNESSVSGTIASAKSHIFLMEEKPIDIVIKKLDENGEYLPNAVMRVREGDSIQKQWITEGNEYIISLKAGTYTLVEMNTPTGYNKSDNLDFSIRERKLYINDNEVVDKTITMISSPKPKFKFANKDSETDKFLSNAWMIITRNEMPVASFYSADDFYELYLDDGEYKLEEKVSPTGYKLSSPISFKIENGILKDKHGNKINSIEMKDNLAKGKLTITKTDQDDENKFLPNTKFRFWGTDYEGNPIEKIVITDANGKIELDDLLLGEYHYQEIENPKGYELDDKIYDISLKSDESSLDEGSPSVTNKEMCEIYNSDDRYYFYDYDNGKYSEEKSYYKDYLGDGSLYVGGNAYSGYSEDYILDNDPNDFTKVLPYGNVFINTDKLTFSNASVLFPADSPFHLIKEGDKEIDVKGNIISDSVYNANAAADGQISYLGYLKSYIKDVGAPGAYGTSTFGQLTEEGFNALYYGGDKEDGTKAQHYEEHDVKIYGNTIVHYKNGQNIISNPTDGYVYKIIYQDATVLPDGSIGDLVLTVDEVIMESATDKLENIVYGIQKANQFSSNPVYGFNNETTTTPASSRWPAFVFGPNASNKSTTVGNGSYKTRNAIGVSIEWSVSAIDKSGNPVDGAISYSVKDLDLRGVDNVWGRVKGTEYAEGMEIVSGSKSFAVMPYYDHANDGDTIQEGYVFGSDLAIRVERVQSGNNADGLRFFTPTYVRWRDDNGVKIGNITTTTTNQNSTGTTVDNRAKFEALPSNNGRYYLQRGDNETFDSGFAVLLNAAGSKLRWTASSGASQQSVNTQIFDSSAYVRLQQAHGTGGDLYIEAYDYTDNCSLSLVRRDISVGIGDSHTLAMVPQDGWEIEKITIDGTTVIFEDLSFDDSGVATYEFNGITYTFSKDSINSKKVRVSFNGIQENHSISVDYTPAIEESITNKKAYGNLTINKTDKDSGSVMNGVAFTLTGISDLGEEISITQNTDSFGQIKIENIPAGSYILHEETPINYKAIGDQTVVIARNEETKEIVLDIENEKLKYDVTLQKKVTGNLAETDKYFDYQITVYNGDTAISENLTIEKNGQTSSITNGSTIQLKHDESIIIKNIVVGYNYTIIETDTEYKEKYKIEKSDGGIIVPLTVGNSVSKQTITENQIVTYINNKESSAATGINIDKKSLELLLTLSIFSFSALYFSSKKLRKNNI